MRKILSLAAAMVLLCTCACGEVFEGVTMAEREQYAVTLSGGRLQGLTCVVGQTVQAGEILASTVPSRVYANQDGFVTRVEAQPGMELNGLAVSLAPISRYTVYCTTNGGYNDVSNDWITIGEQVIMKCTYNGSHRGIGRVISVSGTTYNVELLGGDMYVGETVYIYRGEDLNDYSNRIGTGTVVSSDDEQYSVTGTVLSTHVQPGERVCRGQLLYTWGGNADMTVTSPADGIITAISHRNGDQVNADDTIVTITACSDILISLTLTEDQAARVTVGSSAVYTLAADRLEQEHTATVLRISGLAQDGNRTVYLKPDAPETLLGASVTVRLELN